MLKRQKRDKRRKEINKLKGNIKLKVLPGPGTYRDSKRMTIKKYLKQGEISLQAGYSMMLRNCLFVCFF